MRFYTTAVFNIIWFMQSFQGLHAGITGTLSGKVVDSETGTVLLGAAIIVEGTTIGSMADKNGNFLIQNLPAGTYDVSASMIGYSKLTFQNVKINVDLDTRLEFSLTSEVLSLDEVVVTDKKNLIQGEITSSAYFISGEQINNDLPVDSYQKAVGLLPGVVGNHIRGGRETDVIYMLDGLPLQGGLSREISSTFPNSSIVEMMVQTGGFSAEYGQATAGIVNVISKDGRSEVEGNLRFYTDFFDTGLTSSHQTRRLEFDIGGPMTIGLGGPVLNAKYFVAADINTSDTSQHQQLQDAVDSPVFTNYNINSKLSFDIGKNTILSLQGLLSNWKWHELDPQWELNPIGLAENRNYSHRLSASLTHTSSSKFFTTLRVANYAYKREIDGDISEPGSLVFEDPGDPTSRVLSGNQPWEESTKEEVHVVKFDMVGQITPVHLLKMGLDFQNYNLDSKSLRFTALPDRITPGGIIFNRQQNNFSYNPQFFAVYIQDQIEFKGITANLGLRYDLFSPQITVEEEQPEFKKLRAQFQAAVPDSKTKDYTPLSPRLGISLPLSKNERLHFNYGWYYQMPPLYNLATNANQSIDGYLPFIGNTDLQPVKTISSEFSYKRIVGDNLLFVLTGFTKSIDNLIDTQTFIFPDSLLTQNVSTIGYATYTNSASGRASGLEVTLQKKLSQQLSARVSYTYMKASGTSSSDEDEYLSQIFGKPESKNERFPLSWDQRHSFILDTKLKTGNFTLSTLYRLFSPLPVTTQNSLTPNDTRLDWRNILDIKLTLTNRNFWNGRVRPFFEIRNLFDEQNMVNQSDNSGVRAYRLFDPINSDQGRRLRIGMALNF